MRDKKVLLKICLEYLRWIRCCVSCTGGGKSGGWVLVPLVVERLLVGQIRQELASVAVVTRRMLEVSRGATGDMQVMLSAVGGWELSHLEGLLAWEGFAQGFKGHVGLGQGRKGGHGPQDWESRLWISLYFLEG